MTTIEEERAARREADARFVRTTRSLTDTAAALAERQNQVVKLIDERQALRNELDDANKEVARLRRQLERTVSIASWIADRAWVNGSRDHDEGGWDRACPFFLSGPNDGSCDRCGHEKDSHDE